MSINIIIKNLSKYKKGISRKRKNKIIKSLCLMDDTLSCEVFKDIECASFLVSKILDRDITVVSSQVQNQITIPGVKSVRLDLTVENECEFIDVEFENGIFDGYRMFLYLSMMLFNELKENKDVRNTREKYLIVISKKDIFKQGKAIYKVSLAEELSYIYVPSGCHILVVNGEYKGDDEIGKVIRDLNCSEYEDMFYEILRKKVEHYKVNIKGEEKMCEKIDKYIKVERMIERKLGEIEGKRAGRKEGRKEGIQEGRQEGKAEGVREANFGLLVKIMNKMNMNVNDALMFMEIEANEWDEYIQLLNC